MEMVREIQVNYRNALQRPESIKEASGVAEFFRQALPCNSKESFLLLCLDGANIPISYSVISTGLANSAMVHPREVFQPAILSGAVSIVVAHNHPSGTLTPSKEDHKVTKTLKEVGDLIGIRVLDHIIITDFSHYSFLENDVF